MKIRKNGKVITLSESDLRRIVKRVLNEQDTNIDDIPDREYSTGATGLKWNEESDVFTMSSSDIFEYKIEVDLNDQKGRKEVTYYTRHKRRNAPMGSDFRWKDMEKTLSPQNFKIAKERIDEYVRDNKRDFSNFILDAILGSGGPIYTR